jgi:hypothetical protein
VCVQLGGIIAANIYRDHDKPLYHRGNRVLLGINFLSIFLFLFAKGYYVLKNKIRDRKWNAMTKEVSFCLISYLVRGIVVLMFLKERLEYTLNTSDKASRRLDFRFAH